MAVFTETGEGEKMEEKKEYVAPEMKVVDMEYTQMLCGSCECPDENPCTCGEIG